MDRAMLATAAQPVQLATAQLTPGSTLLTVSQVSHHIGYIEGSDRELTQHWLCDRLLLLVACQGTAGSLLPHEGQGACGLTIGLCACRVLVTATGN